MNRRSIVLVLTLLLVATGASAQPRPKSLQSDCGSGADAGDTADAALHMPGRSISCSARHGPDDEADWFSFDGAYRQRMSLVISLGAPTWVRYCLYAPDGSLARACQTLTSGAVMPALLLPEAGRYTMSLSAVDEVHRGSYLLSLSLGKVPVFDDCGSGQDAGDSPATALLLALPAACTAHTTDDSADHADFYAFDLAGPSRIVVTHAHAGGRWIETCLEGAANGTRRCEFSDAMPSFVAYATEAGRWHLSTARGHDGEYTFTVDAQPLAAQDDCGTGADAGDGAATAAPIALPVTGCAGVRWDGDAADWYAFEADAGDVLLTTTVADAPGTLCLARPDGETYRCDALAKGATPKRVVLDRSGTWALGITLARAYGEHSLDARLARPAATGQDDCASGADAADLRQNALAVATPAVCAGTLDFDALDLDDWYAIDAQAGEPIALTLTPDDGSLVDLCLYAPGETQARECRNVPGDFVERIERRADVAGRWLARVSIASGAGGYALQASKASTQDDCGSGFDAGDRAADATPLASATLSCEGTFPPLLMDREDWYSVPLAAGEPFAAAIAMVPFSTARLCLHAPEGGPAVACGQGALQHVPDRAGAWLLQAKVASGSGRYEMALAQAPAAPSA